jgi:hypothetical protein
MPASELDKCKYAKKNPEFQVVVLLHKDFMDKK